MSYLGIDLGTSAAKVVLVDEGEAILAQAQAPVATARPHPLWSEQDPRDWWTAVSAALDAVAAAAPEAMRRVRGIGLSGQMHAATLLDAADEPVRPAILWNDGRAHAEAAELAAAHPGLAHALGVPPMPGFTAPKLVWLARHEPAAMDRARTILPAKGHIRPRLSAERAIRSLRAAGLREPGPQRRRSTAGGTRSSSRPLRSAVWRCWQRSRAPRHVAVARPPFEGSEAAGVLRRIGAALGHAQNDVVSAARPRAYAAGGRPGLAS